MNTPTPRTDAAWSGSFDGKQLSAGQTARALRECSQKLESELTTLTAERDHLHAQLRALTLICGTNDANRFETWIDRANARAEEAEANLAVERARLDWLETPSGMDWQWEPERLTVSRASIDAAMKEDAK
jgi:hypothetical protein